MIVDPKATRFIQSQVIMGALISLPQGASPEEDDIPFLARRPLQSSRGADKARRRAHSQMEKPQKEDDRSRWVKKQNDLT